MKIEKGPEGKNPSEKKFFAQEQLTDILTLHLEKDVQNTEIDPALINAFFQEMANPSRELIESCATVLLQNPKEVFSKDRIDFIDQYEKKVKEVYLFDTEQEKSILIQGIQNTGILFTIIQTEIDKNPNFFLDNSQKSENNTSALIERKMLKHLTENGIKQLSQEIMQEPDLKKRHEMGLGLKKRIKAYYKKFPHMFFRNDEKFDAKWRDLVIIDYLSAQDEFGNFHTQLELIHEIITAETAIQRYELEKRLQRLPALDKNIFEKYRMTYGAKAANLIILRDYCQTVNAVLKGADVQMQIPNFLPVPVDLHNKWEKNVLTDQDLSTCYAWIKNQQCIIRSSAVYSEDGEKHTGAGIYESIVLPAGATYEEFKNAVFSVFASTNSVRARTYRQSIGVEQEEQMGLIIQRYESADDHGHINSYLSGIPTLNEIVTEKSRNLINKKVLDFYLAADIDFNNIPNNLYHSPPDNTTVENSLPVKLSRLTEVLKRIWQSEIQVEFVSKGNTIYVVQVRQLPDAVDITTEITFPDEKPIFTGFSLGIGDFILDVLNSNGYNRFKNGVVFFEYNLMDEFNIRNFPKEGAIVIVNNGGENGHLQTLAGQYGLMCFFCIESDNNNWEYQQLIQQKRVRVVSNGIRGGVYKVEERE